MIDNFIHSIFGVLQKHVLHNMQMEPNGQRDDNFRMQDASTVIVDCRQDRKEDLWYVRRLLYLFQTQ